MSMDGSARWLVQRQVWLVRRAETNWEAAGRLAGDDGRPILTARGVRQAHAAAGVLADARVTAVIASDLRSDVQTALPTARAAGLRVTRDPALRGRGLGLAGGVSCRSVGPELTGIDQGRVVDADAAPPGGETVRMLYARVSRFLAELLGGQLDGDVALVADGAVVRVALAWLDGTGPADMAWAAARDDRIRGRAVPVPVPLLAPGPDRAPGAPTGVGVGAGAVAVVGAGAGASARTVKFA